MNGPILASPATVVAEGGDDLTPELLLLGLLEIAVERTREILVGSRRDLLHHGYERRLEFLEHLLQARFSRSGLVEVEQGVVGMILVAQALGGLSPEREYLLQVGCECPSVGYGPRPPPGRFRQGGRSREFLDQADGQLLGTAGDAARGHVSLLVPEEQRPDAPHVAYGRQAVLEQLHGIVRFVGDHVAYTSITSCGDIRALRSIYGIAGARVGQ